MFLFVFSPNLKKVAGYYLAWPCNWESEIKGIQLLQIKICSLKRFNLCYRLCRSKSVTFCNESTFSFKRMHQRTVTRACIFSGPD